MVAGFQASGSRIGVAVVSFGADGGQLQGADRCQLVGGQGLGGRQVERHGAVVVDLARMGQGCKLGTVDRVQGGQLIRQGLAGGRAGGNDHVLSGVGQFGGLDLVTVGLVDAQGTVCVHEIGVNHSGHGEFTARRAGMVRT